MYRMADGLDLVLASASPRRRELLSRAGLQFIIKPAEADESLLPGENAEAASLRLAGLKARAAAGGEAGNRVILAADTLVELDGIIMGKPADLEEAREMLELLSGWEHRVVTGFHLLGQGWEEGGTAVTLVRFRELSPAEIEAYAATAEPLGKAGAYAIQERAAAFVSRVEGSYTNVVGLPLSRVLEAMLARGVAVARGRAE